MKKRELFKKQIASLLALCMVSNFFIATDAGILNIGGSDTIVAQATENTDADAGATATGRVEVTVSMALFLDKAEFTATLIGSDCEPVTVQFTKEKTDTQTITFSQIPDGDYTLQVAGNGFRTYEQLIEIRGGKLYTLQLTAGFCEGYSYSATDDGLHPGVLLIGNADGEGDIDADDRDHLIDLIHEGVQVDENTKSADLNGDDEINIEDLMFFAKGYLEDDVTKNTLAYVEEFLSPDAVKAYTPENVIVEGKIEDVLSGEGEVTFKVEGDVTQDNPIVVGFDVASEEPIDGISFGVSPETPIQEAVIDVETAEVNENGEPVILKLPLRNGVHFTTEEDVNSEGESKVYAEIDSKGNIQVHLGAQIAVKKVSLRVTAVAKASGESTNLVTIAKTEFVNGMESRIPEPEVTAPQNVKAKAGSDSFTVTWDPVLNVTGYEVVVTKKEDGSHVKTISTSATSATVGDNNHNSSKKLIKNLTTYQVTVQAVNGAWRSQLSDTVEVTPMPSGKPDMVNNVSAVGAYKKLTVKWSSMPDTTNYRVYYKLRGSSGEPAMEETTKTECVLEDLEDKKEYELYVIGSNKIGDAPPSLTVFAETGSFKPVTMPRYGVINLDEKGIPSSNHVVSVTRNGGATIEGADDNALVLADRENKTGWVTLDNDIDTFSKITTWDDGGFNGLVRDGPLGIE
ncbi:MAG: fibronectin type III domain-containing protein [Oscillospiraceae bacterium]|nr:fibronectin type III domain-containing protein [Oscillospiraceae bacterium]